ncbi:MAG: hypothetical protein HYS07_06115 [Chlamydiae bacterium]|nr:hypothetical protein [Chlamydiota bacterium]MBI3277219.1 hypothetical protein [Chlamydiota bacterium]
MSQKGLEQLIGKALADEKFLDSFLKNPEAKVKEAGLDISVDELLRIKKIDTLKARQFAESFAKEFGDRKQGLFV